MSVRVGYVAQFFAVQALVAVLQLVPLALSGWVVQRVANIYFLCSPKRRQIALDNLTLAYGEELSADWKRTIARRSFESQALSMLELFVIKKMKIHAERRFTITGEEHVEAAVARGKGIVFVASHLGSWEYVGFGGYLRHLPRGVLVKNVKNPYLNNTINALRRLIDTLPITKEAGALRQTLAVLRRNHGVAIIIDQWAGAEGVWVNFFGRATSTTSLPARLAQKTGCALVPIVCMRQAIGRYEIRLLPQLFVPGDDPAWEVHTTQRLNEMLEAQIRTCPEQWSWSHRRWRPRKNSSVLPK